METARGAFSLGRAFVVAATVVVVVVAVVVAVVVVVFVVNGVVVFVVNVVVVVVSFFGWSLPVLGFGVGTSVVSEFVPVETMTMTEPAMRTTAVIKMARYNFGDHLE